MLEQNSDVSTKRILTDWTHKFETVWSLKWRCSQLLLCKNREFEHVRVLCLKGFKVTRMAVQVPLILILECILCLSSVYIGLYMYIYIYIYIYTYIFFFFFFYWLLQPTCGFQPPHAWGFEITLNDTPQSVGLLWTSDRPVAETSTWQTHNINNKQTSMPSAGFEPTIPAGERLQTHSLDRSATGIGVYTRIFKKYMYIYIFKT
jgi:hypothetical protein